MGSLPSHESIIKDLAENTRMDPETMAWKASDKPRVPMCAFQLYSMAHGGREDPQHFGPLWDNEKPEIKKLFQDESDGLQAIYEAKMSRWHERSFYYQKLEDSLDTPELKARLQEARNSNHMMRTTRGF